jgi:hypothetical protein
MSDTKYLEDGLNAISDIKSTLLLLKIIPFSEREKFFQIINENIDYVESQIVISKSMSISIDGKIHITAPVIETLYMEMTIFKTIIKNNDTIDDNIKNLLQKIEFIEFLITHLIILLDHYPYSNDLGWQFFGILQE